MIQTKESRGGTRSMALFQGLGCGTGCIRTPLGCGWHHGILLDEGEVYIEGKIISNLLMN